MHVCRRERGPRATGGSLRAGARRRGAARATLFIKEPSYAAVATVAAPAADGRESSQPDLSLKRPTNIGVYRPPVRECGLQFHQLS